MRRLSNHLSMGIHIHKNILEDHNTPTNIQKILVENTKILYCMNWKKKSKYLKGYFKRMDILNTKQNRF